MGLSTFVLTLFVFLQSGSLLKWFTVDPKLLGVVGIVYVVIVVVEALLAASGKPFRLPFPRRHQDAPAE